MIQKLSYVIIVTVIVLRVDFIKTISQTVNMMGKKTLWVTAFCLRKIGTTGVWCMNASVHLFICSFRWQSTQQHTQQSEWSQSSTWKICYLAICRLDNKRNYKHVPQKPKLSINSIKGSIQDTNEHNSISIFYFPTVCSVYLLANINVQNFVIQSIDSCFCQTFFYYWSDDMQNDVFIHLCIQITLLIRKTCFN